MSNNNHRFLLSRGWLGGRGTVNFIMLNPSTADDVFDDPTIRKCIGFGKRWGYTGMVVTNLFAYRATLPNDLEMILKEDPGVAKGDDGNGPGNNDYIVSQAEAASIIVCAWGDCGNAFRPRAGEVLDILKRYRLHCIGTTKDGAPLHPSRARYTAAPVPFIGKSLVGMTIPEAVAR